MLFCLVDHPPFFSKADNNLRTATRCPSERIQGWMRRAGNGLNCQRASGSPAAPIQLLTRERINSAQPDDRSYPAWRVNNPQCLGAQLPSHHQKFLLFSFLSWQLLGPSALTAIAVFLFLLPLNFVITKKRSQFQVHFALVIPPYCRSGWMLDELIPQGLSETRVEYPEASEFASYSVMNSEENPFTTEF